MQLAMLVMVRLEEWFVSMVQGTRQRTKTSEQSEVAVVMPIIVHWKNLRGDLDTSLESV
jgi:hypothetical protein